ncbi:MAG TPA: CHAD domain-containing protein [Candidatus Angelobacter sp.]
MTFTDKRIKTLFRSVSSAIVRLKDAVSPKRVHRLRTSIRRIQSAVTYTQPKLGRKQQDALDQLGKLRKRAGKVRDLDVQMVLLRSLGNGSTRPDRRSLQEFFAARRVRQAHRLLATVQKLQRAKHLDHLERLAAAVQTSWTASNVPDRPLRQARTQIAGLDLHVGSHAQLRPGELHQVRIALKLARYLAELADESEERQRLLEQLKAVQDALGEWHDWEELARAVEKEFSHLVNRPIMGEIRALFAAKQAAARFAVSNFAIQYQIQAGKPARSVAARGLAQRIS